VDEVALTPALLARDALVFGLRLNPGVDLGALVERFPDFDFAALDSLWRDLIADGLLEKSVNIIRLTRAGRLVADRVGVGILTIADSQMLADEPIIRNT
jgi:oxygen-independent coproporphyrinogen-3 oxidase